MLLMVSLLAATLSNDIDIQWNPASLTAQQRAWCERFAREAAALTAPSAAPNERIDALKTWAAQAKAADLPRVADYLDRTAAFAAGGDGIAAEQALKAEAEGPVIVLVRVQKTDAAASPFSDIILGLRHADQQWLADFQRRLDAFARTLPGFSASWDKGNAPHGVSYIADLALRAGASVNSTAPASYPPFDPALRTAVGRSWIHWRNMNIANWFGRSVQPAIEAFVEPSLARRADGAALARWYALRYVTTDLGAKVVRGETVQTLLGDAWAPITIVKADVTAVLASQWLKKAPLDTDLVTFLGLTFHTLNDVMRGEAPPQHRASTCIVLNWCLRHGGLTARDDGWRIEPRAMQSSLRGLTREVLEIETNADRARAEKLIAEYGQVTPGIQNVIDRLAPPTPPKATVHYEILDAQPLRIQRLSWAGVRLDAAQSTLFIDPKGDGVPLAGGAKRRAVLITHIHNDHFDAPAVKQLLADGGAVFCLDVVAPVIASKGIVTRPVSLFHPESFGDFVFIPVPAADGFGDVEQVSWIVKAGGMNLIHCGDTIWHGGFDLIGRTYGPFDVAFLPINGVMIRGRAVDVDVPATMTPSEAVAAAAMLRAKRVVPIHYGLTGDDDYREQPDAVGALQKSAAAKGVRVEIVPEGGWVSFF